MSDAAKPVLRERMWVTKWDHTVDPPQPIEEVFVENGVVRGIRSLMPTPVPMPLAGSQSTA